MEGGRRQLRLLGRLLGKLRGGNNVLEKGFSTTSSGYSKVETALFMTATASTGSTAGSMLADDTDEDAAPSLASSQAPLDETQFAANIDLRYGGQYLSPEQLPEFCNQLHHLVEVIRNIQSYAKITGEYPSELERRLQQEARELAALAAEARNARDVVVRTRAQRRAVRAQKKQIVAHLASLKETETRELENSIRLADRKLYLSWEALKDSNDPAALEPLLDEVRTKQRAFDNLVRLIECRRSTLARKAGPTSALPPPEILENSDGEWHEQPPKESREQLNSLEPSSTRKSKGLTANEFEDQANTAGRKRFEGSKRNYKRKRAAAREPRSVPLSGEPSRHGPQSQDSDSTARYSVASAGAVALPPLELPSHGSYRDILFFTVN